MKQLSLIEENIKPYSEVKRHACTAEIKFGTEITIIDFIRQDIVNKQAPFKHVAVTEWNGPGGTQRSSYINGMMAVITTSEFIKQNYGMSARWLIANWETDGMFYKGNNSNIPTWNPRPDVFYLYYLQRFFGDHIISTVSDQTNVLTYASTFSSGETGIIVVNKGTTEYTIRLDMPNHTVGERNYIYSVTGGIDNGDFSQIVNINDTSPVSPWWGPINELETISAKAHKIDGEIKFISPALSVQYILVEPGNNVLSAEDETKSNVLSKFILHQNFQNPFNPTTTIGFGIIEKGIVRLSIVNILGEEIRVLFNEEKEAGYHSVDFNAIDFPSGVYFYRIKVGNFLDTKKMILLR